MKRTLTIALALSAALLPAALAAPIKDNTIAGTVVDWPAGKKGEVQLRVYRTATNSGTAGVLASAPVDEKGQFLLTLPGAAALDGALVPAAESKEASTLKCGPRILCNGDLTIPAGARVNLFDLTLWIDGVQVGTALLRTSTSVVPTQGEATAILAYSTAPARVVGEFRSWNDFSSRVNTWDTALETGWNWVVGETGAYDKEKLNWPVRIAARPLPQGLSFALGTTYTGIGVDLNENSRGVVSVSAVREGTPAQAAGLQAKDVITAVNGQAVPGNALSVAQQLSGPPGSEVTVTVRRGGELLEFKVKRGEFPYVYNGPGGRG